MMKRGPWLEFGAVLLVVLIVIGVMIVSAIPSGPTQFAQEAQDSADALDSVHSSAPDCNSMAEQCHGLDINQYFTALPKLSIRRGYALDYVIQQDGLGSYPVIYVRGVNDPPFADIEAYWQAEDEGKLPAGDFMDYIEVEDTAEGYLQYAVLYLLQGQFYLGWHANYYDTIIVSTSEQLEYILNSQGFGMDISQDVAEKARKLDLNPTVRMNEKDATVSMVIFTKWGGFYRMTMKFDRAMPHTVLDHQEESLVEYQCGIMF